MAEVGDATEQGVAKVGDAAKQGVAEVGDAVEQGVTEIDTKAKKASEALTTQSTEIQQQLSEQYTITIEAMEEEKAAAKQAELQKEELSHKLDSRKEIAMILFDCAQSTFQTGNQNTIASAVAYDLLSDFNQFFLQSPRFRLLSRQDDQVVDAEKIRILDNAAAAGTLDDLHKIGMDLGLDYVVTGALKQLYIAPLEVTTIQLTGNRTSSISRAMIELDYRIVNIATREILWADHIFIDLTPAEIKGIGYDVVTLYHALTNMASRRIAEAMDAISPIRVIKVLQNGQFLLDRGGNLIIPGSFFDIFRQGEPILDSETGEELGRPEEQLATIQIKRVDPRNSYGEIVIGSGVITPSDMEGGIIARPHRDPIYLSPAPAPAPAAPPVIKLPFDK